MLTVLHQYFYLCCIFNYKSCRYIVFLLTMLVPVPVWPLTVESLTEGEVIIDDYAYVIPYIYYTDSTELTVGGLFISEGLWQPQLNFSATAYTSANDSNGAWFEISDIKITDRVGINFEAYSQRWTNLNIYSADPTVLTDTSGSRNSSSDDFLKSNGDETVWNLSVSYVLPIGSTRNNAIHEYKLNKRGILYDSTASGGREFNPMKTGRSIVTAGFRHNTLAFDDNKLQGTYQRSLAAYLQLEHDNTDYFRNPSYGSRQSFIYKNDWGGSHSDVSWTTLELDLSKYIDLGTSDWAQQQVLALNAWYKMTPTWDKKENNLYRRPPVYQRAGLGGFKRLRAYPTHRFNDHSASYYSAEYRVTPTKNIFSNLGFLNSIITVKWVQFVAFAELGQVNSKFDFSELHKDMHWDIGLGIRGFVNGVVMRFDAAYGEDGRSFSAFVGHTF